MSLFSNLITPPIIVYDYSYDNQNHLKEDATWKKIQYTQSRPTKTDKLDENLYPSSQRTAYQYQENRFTYHINDEITCTQRLYYGVIAVLMTAAFAALILSFSLAFGVPMPVTAKIAVGTISLVGMPYVFVTIKQMWNLALFKKSLIKCSILMKTDA